MEEVEITFENFVTGQNSDPHASDGWKTYRFTRIQIES